MIKRSMGLPPLKLTNFLETLNNKSRHLHTVVERVVSLETPTAAMIASKMTQIQLSFDKTSFNG